MPMEMKELGRDVIRRTYEHRADPAERQSPVCLQGNDRPSRLRVSSRRDRVTDVVRERAKYESRGFRAAFEAPVPSGGSVCYLENGSLDPAFIELIPATPGMDDMFTRFWRATVDWNQKDPVRPFA